jgi:hypothetical protein
VVERKNIYPLHRGSNIVSDMFTHREPIVVEALHEPWWISHLFLWAGGWGTSLHVKKWFHHIIDDQLVKMYIVIFKPIICNEFRLSIQQNLVESRSIENRLKCKLISKNGQPLNYIIKQPIIFQKGITMILNITTQKARTKGKKTIVTNEFHDIMWRKFSTLFENSGR